MSERLHIERQPLRIKAATGSILAFIILVANIAHAAGQTATPGQPSICAAMLPTVQALPSNAVPTEGGFAIPSTPLATLDDAQAAYDFPLLLPTAIPHGYQLGRIVYEHSMMPQFDILTVCYVSPDGHYVQIQQGVPIDVGASRYRMTPDGEKGTTMVQGQQAYWTDGVLLTSGDQGVPPLGGLVWQPGPLRVSWQTDIMVPRLAGAFFIPPGSNTRITPPPAYVGYQIESDSLSLDCLAAIADSVQPYALDSGP